LSYVLMDNFCPYFEKKYLLFCLGQVSMTLNGRMESGIPTNLRKLSDTITLSII